MRSPWGVSPNVETIDDARESWVDPELGIQPSVEWGDHFIILTYSITYDVLKYPLPTSQKTLSQGFLESVRFSRGERDRKMGIMLKNMSSQFPTCLPHPSVGNWGSQHPWHRMHFQRESKGHKRRQQRIKIDEILTIMLHHFSTVIHKTHTHTALTVHYTHKDTNSPLKGEKKSLVINLPPGHNICCYFRIIYDLRCLASPHKPLNATEQHDISKTPMTKSSHQKTLPTGEIDANC